jgi:hypothetical protein
MRNKQLGALAIGLAMTGISVVLADEVIVQVETLVVRSGKGSM